ncbi:hypothetical protein [Arthrobacter sp. STN4]|uniref:hypothetical protein n=1 Tax=Arthrobacter sp. STN4 TaxID=2923276 RepID=UPI002119C522|nr:hypothetical protein [Arthrobacter sp. STN4]MCQ9165489.1 hypothetical protein [Arthrobacter sp. STN4]
MAESIDVDRMKEDILERVCRCAANSRTEAEYVRGLYAAGFVVHPVESVWGDGYELVGYSVGGLMAGDMDLWWYDVAYAHPNLSLDRLREVWESNEELEWKARCAWTDLGDDLGGLSWDTASKVNIREESDE